MSGEREIASRRIGEFVMAELKPLDQVAYVRFASVYRRFEDVHAFRLEIEKLLRSAGLKYHFRSRGPAHGAVDVAVGDVYKRQLLTRAPRFPPPPIRELPAPA